MKRIATSAFAALILAMIFGPILAQAQQGGTTRFVYDDNGRLIAVITPNGEAAVYDYDASGNFTAIRRIGADTLTLMAFFPHEGGAGDQVTFVGTGFNAGVTSVSFNSSTAQVISVTPSAVVALVPDSATTGPVTIMTPRGTLVTPTPFTIVPRVRVIPTTAVLLPTDSVVFTAVVGGGGDQTVTWSVNGIAGGNNSVGTISSSGLYVAPTPPGNASITLVVRVTSVAQPSLFAEAQVKVLNPVSVGALFAHSVSVRRGDPLGVAAARAPRVSVRRGVVINGTSSTFSHMLSVHYGPAAGTAATVFSPFVSATTGPYIASVSPGSVARGATVTLTINGDNLGGASALRFVTSSGSLDNAITALNLAVNGAGTQLTTTLTVSSNAATGTRIVVVTASAGTTPAVPTGHNAITVQ